MWFKSIRDAKLRLFTSSPNPWWSQRTKTISADKQAQNWTAGLVLREVSYCYLCEHEDLLQTGPGLTRWVMDNTIFQRRLFCPNLTEFLPSMQHLNYIASGTTSPQCLWRRQVTKRQILSSILFAPIASTAPCLFSVPPLLHSIVLFVCRHRLKHFSVEIRKSTILSLQTSSKTSGVDKSLITILNKTDWALVGIR